MLNLITCRRVFCYVGIFMQLFLDAGDLCHSFPELE